MNHTIVEVKDIERRQLLEEQRLLEELEELEEECYNWDLYQVEVIYYGGLVVNKSDILEYCKICKRISDYETKYMNNK
jgi:hypothetical protein